MKPLLFALLLAGCAIPTQELYMQRAVCVQEGGDCAELELAIARREVAIQRREDAKANISLYVTLVSASVPGLVGTSGYVFLGKTLGGRYIE
jgi:hypothetical protein